MIIYFLLIVIGSVVAGKLILGELRKERRDYIAIDSPNYDKKNAHQFSVQNEQISILSQQSNADLIERIRKVEELLAEKNAELVKLNNVLEAERRHKGEFEKIKSLLQWQIFEIRQSNKQIRKELDSFKIQGQQYQLEAQQLKTELTFKEQILAQNEIRISDLNNRLRNFMPLDSANSVTHPNNVAKPDVDSFSDLDWRVNLTD